MSNINCNENVNCELLYDVVMAGVPRSMYRFTPVDGYALWRDNEEGNLDEKGQPYCYWFSITTPFAEDYAPHIGAKLIDETMEVFGKEDEPEVATYGLRRSVGATEEVEKTSHTYIDENGVERDKKGVY